MRLWSLHPKHLDGKGLVALWREGLLARAVVRGETRGYRHHPQLERFLARRDPEAALDCYLTRVLEEARARGYAFDATKIRVRRCRPGHATVTSGQLEHESAHLSAKLSSRAAGPSRLEHLGRLLPHACFRLVPGPVAPWERPSAERAEDAAAFPLRRTRPSRGAAARSPSRHRRRTRAQVEPPEPADEGPRRPAQRVSAPTASRSVGRGSRRTRAT